MISDLFISVAHAAESKGGMPQLNPESFSSQIFWLIVTFTIMYVLMSRGVIPRIREVMEKRQNQIMDNLDAAQDAKKKAEEARTAYEKELEEAKEKMHALLTSTQSEIAATTQEQLNSLNAKLDAQLDDAQKKLESRRGEVLESIEPDLIDLTGMIVKQLGHAKADKTAIETAVKARVS